MWKDNIKTDLKEMGVWIHLTGYSVVASFTESVTQKFENLSLSGRRK
jgi:hypothetical protein